MKKYFVIFLSPLYILFVVLFLFSKSRTLILEDLTKYYNKNKNKYYNLIFSLIMIPEFRGLFYYRLGKLKYLIQWIHPVRLNLYFMTSEIGPGLKIQHGFSTVIAAKRIGKNCWVNQQVTIGYTNDTDCPTILDNVIIYAGAIVIGNITIGNNSIIGAGAVVTKNVPENAVVVGNPARIIKLNGERVDKKL